MTSVFRLLVLLGVSSGVIRAEPPLTPLEISGSEVHVYRQIGDAELRLHVVYPDGWTAADSRPCVVAFFSGGWSSGTPERSMKWVKWAAENGFVGIAPDYRTRERFGGTPEDCVSDARAAMRWLQSHADDLGIDVSKIIVQGSSAGGHLAAWTAIPKYQDEDIILPESIPAALILVCPVTDTKETGYGGPKRFGGDVERAFASSIPDNLPEKMPPTIIFHATGDPTVPYVNSADLRDRMILNGSSCRLVTFEGLGHAYFARSKFGDKAIAADKKTYEEAKGFLARLGLAK
ncbi:alpha/beta hydrolase [Puniceicoccaceae bacterium K14]|nr:alpha/beta hydrolase [Puniceicoccaceae bacterium K14]